MALTSTISIINGLISGLDSFCTMTSSSIVLHTTYTMYPRRSKSRDSDLVMGSAGEPAITTTSSLAPLGARFARRRFRLDFLLTT